MHDGAAPSRVAQIGRRVAALRDERRMTLDHLAAATGFTKGYLSKIEHGHKTPPIGTLARIAQALEIDLPLLFLDPGEARASRVCVTRAHEGQPAARGGSAFGYDYQGLAAQRAVKRMQPFVFSFPRDIDRGVYFEHEGEEFLYVLEGRVEFEVAGAGGEWRKWLLEAGDSIYFDSRTPHKGRAVDGEARALVVVCAPEREDGRSRDARARRRASATAAGERPR